MDNEEKNIKWYAKPSFYGLSFGLLGFGIMIWFFIMLIPKHLNVTYDISIEKSAQIGDFIGGVVATLFSIAAFLLLYETLNTQKEEIKENKGILLKQSFETNLFQMINVHNDFVKEFDVQADEKYIEKNSLRKGYIITVGRDSFNFVYTQYMKSNIINSRVGNKTYIKNEVFDVMLNDWSDDLNHYFKHACEIIKYITTTVIDEKQQYMSLFSSGLSDSEKALLYYYILFYSDENFKKELLTYDFFKDLPSRKLISEEHKNWIYE